MTLRWHSVPHHVIREIDIGNPAPGTATSQSLRSVVCFGVTVFQRSRIMEQTADIALIGLAVMGQNLILNMADHGYTVVAFNRTVSKVDDFLNEAAKGHPRVVGAHSIEEMV